MKNPFFLLGLVIATFALGHFALGQTTNQVKIFNLPVATDIPDASEIVINVSTNAGDTRRTGFTNFVERMRGLSRGPLFGGTNITTTNATMFGLHESVVSGILRLYGLEQGSNSVLYFNGSNIVINAVAASGGGSSNGLLFDDGAGGGSELLFDN